MHRSFHSSLQHSQRRPLSRRHLFQSLLACTAILTGCATAARQPALAPTSSATVLRLLDISPRDGTRLDSSAVLVARLAYVIPDFDPEQQYVVSTLFAQVGGAMSSVGSEDVPLQAPYGIVTIRRPVKPANSRLPNNPITPLTGVFYLLKQGAAVAAPDTVVDGNLMRVSGRRQMSVEARSRTFYYNGSGPARSLARGLPAILEEYWTYRSKKALAVAYDSASMWTYGYTFGYPTADAAVAAALEQCKASAVRRKITAPCEIVASDADGAK